VAEICLFAKFAKLARWQQRDIQNLCYLSELWVPGCPKYPAQIDVTQNRWQKKGTEKLSVAFEYFGCSLSSGGSWSWTNTENKCHPLTQPDCKYDD